MPMDYAAELEAARNAAIRAGHEILKLYESFEAIADAPADISTEADRRSQEVILETLTRAFPNDAFCAEETGVGLSGLRREGPRLWIIDPIDGSRGFAKKLGEFSVMIGLVERYQVRLGLVLEPARKRMTFAIKGEGCWTADGELDAVQEIAPCHVSPVERWEEARLVRSHSEKHLTNEMTQKLKRLDYTYSAGIKMAMVARGEVDLYLSSYTGFNSWDVCAGHILVEEAGGRVTDAHGQPITYRQDGSGRIIGTVATNGFLHELAQKCVLHFLT
ncbi:MAG: 3'(2'),5'-bisphosphate nucleotidase CysQ [Gemmatales bacterium]|nr:3'(2'),5'-bisphosphate nucleotidase CysQ [Gemmatales bacterium]MDW8387783.1 inositol monophosphatase family protein [Gemmatales bacterium]